MSHVRLAILLGLILLLLVPLSAGAAGGPYFCSVNAAAGGNGSSAHPWSCPTVTLFNDVVAQVCRAGGGTLYFIFSGGYIEYSIGPNCDIKWGNPQPGTPPSTGATVPAPLALAAAATLALGLLGTGVGLRRSSSRA